MNTRMGPWIYGIALVLASLIALFSIAVVITMGSPEGLFGFIPTVFVYELGRSVLAINALNFRRPVPL